jgi:hypothetical protein
MIYALLVISGMLFVLWIIGVEAQHVEDAGAGRTGRDLPDRRPLDRVCDGGHHQRQRAARKVKHIIGG